MQVLDAADGILLFYYLFKLQMGFYPVALLLQ
jgi:hypothetical protein